MRRKNHERTSRYGGGGGTNIDTFSFSAKIRVLLIVFVFAASFFPLYFYHYAGLAIYINNHDPYALAEPFVATSSSSNKRLRPQGVNAVVSRRPTVHARVIDGTNSGTEQQKQQYVRIEEETDDMTVKKKETTTYKDDTSSISKPEFAYVFLIGGIHEDRPAYKGFLFNVLIANQILRKTGSRADVWLLVQFSPDSQLTDALPEEDFRLLEALDIHVRVLPKPVTAESFSEVVYEKFRILQMTDYRRVMFLDADIIPLANLDYLFDLSLNGTLRPNLIVATRGEPCNAGLFILEPTATAWDELQQVILDQHESAKDLPYPKFDRVKGWGHSFLAAGDEWTGIVQTGRRWNYHASHSDQGLLFYWAKYLKQDTSIVIGNRIENWVSHDVWKRETGGGNNNNNEDHTDESQPVKLSTLSQEELVKFTSKPPLAYQNGCDKKPENSFLCYVPYSQYAHFSGKGKPWQHPLNKLQRQWSEEAVENINQLTDRLIAPSRLWFQQLRELNQQLDMGIDNDFWANHNMDSPLGYMAMFRDHHLRVEQFHNTTTE